MDYSSGCQVKKILTNCVKNNKNNINILFFEKKV